MTLSTPIKVVVLAGLALILGGAGLLMLASHRSAPSAPVVVPPQPRAHASVVHARVTPAPKVKAVPKAKPRPAPVHIDAGVPSVVAAALRHRPVAVIAIYDSRNASDRAFLAEARAGAHAAHAAFVSANVANNQIAAGVATWWSSVAVPEVVIAKRPGTIAFTSGSATDRETVTQAALGAR